VIFVFFSFLGTFLVIATFLATRLRAVFFTFLFMTG
jgi:hypothetical protein